ncbi:MAG: gliding motility-associated C-terminal domain-containing protein [Chitinophagaceae bacterium]|nr:gliding motility-associated C-terminal domain-containing protein [Chitinophagaceae bacterium]
MVKYLLPLILLVVFSTGNLLGQSPGGISANNKLWLRSDNGVTTSGTTVTQWQENSGAAVTGNFTVLPLAGTANVQTGPTLIPAGVNFNPYLSFDGITNSLSSVNNFLGTALVSNSNVTVFQVLNLKSGIVWLKWETDFLGTTGRLGFENSAGLLRFDFPKAVPATAGQNVGVTNILNKHTLSTAYVNVNTSVNRLNGADDKIIPIPGPGNFGTVSTKIVLGNEDLLNLPCKVDLAEVIIYSNTLTAVERNKVESYLAVKYGVTLNQLAANANNYVASDATVTWDRALNSAYANDITGIGRDDATALSQKQSRSINTTSLATLYNGTYPGGIFPALNSTNANSFSNNLSFLLIGDNGGTTTIDQCALDGRAGRMQRTWKASQTGTQAPVTIAVDQASVPATVKFLLVSTNPAFPLAGTTIYPLSAAAGNWYSPVTLNHNDYFTFASDTTPVPQVPDVTICRNANGTLTITNPAPGAVYNWYDQPTGGVLVGTGTSITLNNLLSDTTLYVETRSVFNCILNGRVAATIHVQTVATPTANTVQPTCTVGTGSITVTAPTGAGYQYCINGANCQAGLTFPNLPPGTYSITAVNALGCISSILTVTINAQPPTPAAPGVTTPVSICAGQTAVLNILNPLAGNTYNWYATATGTIPLSTGVSFTTPVLLNPTTYYAEAVNPQGCASSRTNADVLIMPKLSQPVVTVSQVTDSSILFSWSAVLGADAYLVSTDGISYTVPSSGPTGTTHLAKPLPPNTSLTLYVKATNSVTPCIISNAGTATGKTLSKATDIFVPGAFTPNGDAVNNTLKVFGDIKTYEFSIYNRFGQRIFHTTTLNAGWDGNYKGSGQPSGTYVWTVSAILGNGHSVQVSGTSLLIR